jgi:hypothetical protein
MADAMEVEAAPAPSMPVESVVQEDEQDEEACSDLTQLLEDATAAADGGNSTKAIPILTSILQENQARYGPTATSIKESSVYALARAYCASSQYNDIVSMLTGDVCGPFFESVTKAKCAKVVRAVLDTVCSLAPNEVDMVRDTYSWITSGCDFWFTTLELIQNSASL